MQRIRAIPFKDIPWHPFLLALFPVLALYAANLQEMAFSAAVRPLLVSFITAVVLYILLRLVLRSTYKAAAATTLTLLLIFSYGHVYQFIKTIGALAPLLGRHRTLGPLYFVVFILGFVWILRTRADLRVLTQALNLLAVTALVFPMLQIAFSSGRQAVASEPQPQPETQHLSLSQEQPPPDIYYIILDAYARDDVLRDFFQYDNSEFIQQLEAMGFYVAPCSLSNYAETRLSLSSSLNMDHQAALSKESGDDPINKTRTAFLIKNSAARRQFEALGYKIVAFETGYPWSQIEDADIYLAQGSNAMLDVFATGNLNAFEELLVKTSAASMIADLAKILPAFLQPEVTYPNEYYRNITLFTLDQLGSLPRVQGPKFVFAHVVSPHFPYVFGPNGEHVPEDEQREDSPERYRDQVAYLDNRLPSILHQIIADSPTPPIIILQADHGGDDTSDFNRMAILNAYYLPDAGASQLYKQITPVNSFRFIFNNYFSGDYPLLDDTSYYSRYLTPYNFTAIADERPGCLPESP